MDFEWDMDGRQMPVDPQTDTNRDYDRRELRRRLSLDTDYEEPDRLVADRTRKSNLRDRLAQKIDFQICFVDEDDKVDEKVTNVHDSIGGSVNGHPSDEHSNNETVKANGKHLFTNLTSLFMTKLTNSDQNQMKFNSFQSYLDHLHNEAKKSLKAAKEMSQMQSQLEREQRNQIKQSNQQIEPDESNNDQTMVSTNDNTVIKTNELRTKSKKRLQIMELELIKKTTELNGLLVKLLEERDDLLMEQDSLLIDIEDLTQYLLSKNVNK